MTFQISALDAQPFDHLFGMSQDDLAANLAVRIRATENPGFPCRVSLADAEIGEDVILVNYSHLADRSPYRASHAIFVRQGVERARLATDEVPAFFGTRTLSLRAFDQNAMIVAAELVAGRDLASALARMLAGPAADYVHIHFAKFGCYAARADRA
jgi:hypothetical protein